MIAGKFKAGILQLQRRDVAEDLAKLEAHQGQLDQRSVYLRGILFKPSVQSGELVSAVSSGLFFAGGGGAVLQQQMVPVEEHIHPVVLNCQKNTAKRGKVLPVSSKAENTRSYEKLETSKNCTHAT